jgi:hypothetical protein
MPTAYWEEGVRFSPLGRHTWCLGEKGAHSQQHMLMESAHLTAFEAYRGGSATGDRKGQDPPSMAVSSHGPLQQQQPTNKCSRRTGDPKSNGCGEVVSRRDGNRKLLNTNRVREHVKVGLNQRSTFRGTGRSDIRRRKWRYKCATHATNSHERQLEPDTETQHRADATQRFGGLSPPFFTLNLAIFVRADCERGLELLFGRWLMDAV